MCGISGIYTNLVTEQHKHLVDEIIKSQHARGPDYHARITCHGKTGNIVFGHNRLSIIDLSQHARQPMWDATGRYCITYNGEIYNYIELRAELKKSGYMFNSAGDTEVILNAFACWGIEALNRFKGPFAFALYDNETDTLWLCRDRFGVRPLFWLQTNNSLYFASSTHVLAKTFQLKPDLSYIARGLKFLVYEDDSDITAWQNMFSVPASCYLHASFDFTGRLTSKISRYYNLTDAVQTLAHNLSDNTNQLLQLTAATFENAVNIRLRSDVPLGVTLSSGLDSSSVAALIRQSDYPLTGFAYGNPSSKKSEGPLVAKCAKFLGMDMEYIWPAQNEMIESLFETIKAQDAPFASLGIVAQYILFRHINKCGIRVVLGGQGGDEAFMGYRKFMLFWQQQLIRQKRYPAALKNAIQLFPAFLAEIPSIGTYWRHRKRYLGQSGLNSVLQLPASDLQLGNTSHHNLQSRQIQDVTQFSLPTLLRYEDRNGMGNSVESRLPFLDDRLIALGIALPEAVKLRSGYGKWPVRQMMQNKLPNSIRMARFKRGFDIPLKALLKAGLGKSIRNALHETRSHITEFLRPGMEIENVFSDSAFLQRQSAVAEAITLLWLGRIAI